MSEGSEGGAAWSCDDASLASLCWWLPRVMMGLSNACGLALSGPMLTLRPGTGRAALATALKASVSTQPLVIRSLSDTR